MRKVDRKGRTYGELTVLEDSGKRQNGQVMWVCRCSCGKEILVSSANLNSKKKSCGCNRSHSQWGRIEDRQEALRRFVYQRFLRGPARSRDIEWNLTYELAIELSQRPCWYCGLPPQATTTDARHRRGKIRTNSDAVIHWNGLDRVDNSLGYSKENVVSCCKWCNIAKGTRTLDEFKEWIERVHFNLSDTGQIRIGYWPGDDRYSSRAAIRC